MHLNHLILWNIVNVLEFTLAVNDLNGDAQVNCKIQVSLHLPDSREVIGYDHGVSLVHCLFCSFKALIVALSHTRMAVLVIPIQVCHELISFNHLGVFGVELQCLGKKSFARARNTTNENKRLLHD